MLHDFATSWSHVQGAVKMANLRGGSHTLGLQGFLEHMLTRLVENVRLLKEAQVSQTDTAADLDFLQPVIQRTPSLMSFLPLKIELSRSGIRYS
jgi:hypothetical protein